jgi:hypothetical protein
MFCRVDQALKTTRGEKRPEDNVGREEDIDRMAGDEFWSAVN